MRLNERYAYFFVQHILDHSSPHDDEVSREQFLLEITQVIGQFNLHRHGDFGHGVW